MFTGSSLANKQQSLMSGRDQQWGPFPSPFNSKVLWLHSLSTGDFFLPYACSHFDYVQAIRKGKSFWKA